MILAYHGLGDSTVDEDPWFLRVRPATFRAQVDLLLDAGAAFVTVEELAREAAGENPAPGRVALSFDDGMDDNYSVLLPILREYDIPATVYVVTGLIGKRNPWMSESSGARMMTEHELRGLAAAGIELGAHTVSHRDLSRLDRHECLSEMVRSREDLQRLTEGDVATFAYPFCRYGSDAVSAARDAGFVAAVTCHGRGSWSRYEMKRSMITGTDGVARFVLKLAEVYDPLYHSVPGRLVRATTRGARRRVREARAPRRST